MSRFFRLAAGAVVLCLAGCANPGGGATAVLKPVDASADPDVLISNAVECRTSLSSFSGQGVMRIVDTPNKFGLTVNASVVADEEDRLRIRGDKLAGAVQAFDVVMLGSDIGFYVPTQNTLYHGKVDDLKYFAFRFDPEEVLRQMLRPDTSLLLKEWEVVALDARDRSGVIVLEEVVRGNRPRLQLAINRRTGMIASLTQLDAAGEPVLVKTYDDYRGLRKGRKETGNGSVFPYLMSLSWPKDRRMMELHFKAVDGDAVVLDEDFDLATSDGVQYLPLVDASLESDIPDDPIASALPPSGDADQGQM